MDSSGTVSDRRLYLNQSIYDKLPISWKKDLDFYLEDCCKRYTKRTLELTRTYCSEGLLIFDEIGVVNISKDLIQSGTDTYKHKNVSIR